MIYIHACAFYLIKVYDEIVSIGALIDMDFFYTTEHVLHKKKEVIFTIIKTFRKKNRRETFGWSFEFIVLIKEKKRTEVMWCE
jgi:hypothetical protein